MKVFTFFYDRFSNATTSIALEENGIPHYVLMHKQEDADKFTRYNTCRGKAVVTNNLKGLSFQRNSALDIMEKGEWAAFLSDDFKKIRSYPKQWITSKTQTLNITFENQNKYRLKENNAMTLKEMFSMFPKLIELAEKNNIHLIGFGLHDNPLNLRKKFSNKGLCDGRFWLVKKSHYKFDTNIHTIDDFGWTAENLVRHKNVLTLNWCIPYFDRYTAGGYGSLSERLEMRRNECAYLTKKYDPLLKIADKIGCEHGTHLRFYGTENNINTVRKRYGLL